MIGIFFRKFDCEIEEPIRLQKHKVIAQAFAKRKMLYNAGRLSISFRNTHTDPVGLNFELNSVGSNDLSSTWAAALPKLVNRRGALTGVDTGSVSSQRRNSMDSEISISVRRVSVESRRNSVDSQLSVQIAEMKTTRKVNSGRRHRHHRRRRREFSSRRLSKTGPLFSRRESSTSLDSQTHFFNVIARGNDVKDIVPNLKRRTASAGLDGQQFNNLFSNGKLLVPFLPGQSEVSEDENVSLTISESKYNLILSGQRKVKNEYIEELSADDGSKKSGKYSRSDRESRSSRKSLQKRDSRRSKSEYRRSERYQTNSEGSYQETKKLSAESSISSFCPELSQLAVQSSLNSGVSVGTQHNCEKNRGSKQSKTSIDVGVQANAREIATQTLSAYDIEMTELNKSIDAIQSSRSKSQCVSQGTQMSPKSIRSSRESPVLKENDKKKASKENPLKEIKNEKKKSDTEKNLEKIKKNKKKYKNCGNVMENEPLNNKNKYNSSKTELTYEDELLLKDKLKVKITKKKT